MPGFAPASSSAEEVHMWWVSKHHSELAQWMEFPDDQLTKESLNWNLKKKKQGQERRRAGTRACQAEIIVIHQGLLEVRPVHVGTPLSEHRREE